MRTHMSHRGCCGDVVVWLCRLVVVSLLPLTSGEAGSPAAPVLALLDQGMRHEDMTARLLLPTAGSLEATVTAVPNLASNPLFLGIFISYYNYG